MQPCESLRPAPLTSDLTAIVGGCQDARTRDRLLCSFLSLQDYTLYYESYEASAEVRDCWDGLKKSLATDPQLYESMRVWEEIGYARPNQADLALQRYEQHYKDAIQNSGAGAL